MRKFFKRSAAGTLIFCMLTGIMPVGQSPSKAYAESSTAIQPQYEEVQSIVSQYYGEWKDTNYSGAITDKMPSTALLGNGDVGITSYGNRNEKTFLLSKGDFWVYNHSPILGGGVTIGKQPVAPVEPKNLAREATVTASSADVADPLTEAVDGIIGSGNFWASGIGADQWLQLTFAEPITFGSYVIYNYEHASGNNMYNTADWEVQVSDDGSTWKTVSTVTGNEAATRSIDLDEQVTTKYIRLHTTKTQAASNTDKNPRARIAEFEVYEDPMEAPRNLVQDAESVTASSTESADPLSEAVDGILGQGNFWASKVGADQWLQFTYADPVTIGRYVVYNYEHATGNKTYNTSDWELQVSDDGSTWKTVSTVIGNEAATRSVNLAEKVTTKYIRLHTISTQAASNTDKNPRARIAEFELYQEPKDVNYAWNKLVEICGSADATDINLARAEGTTVTASSAAGADPFREAVDGIIGSGNFWASGVGADQWLQLTFTKPVTFGRYAVHNYEQAGGPSSYNTADWEVQVSDDGSTWKTVSTVTGNEAGTRSVELAEKVTTKYVRLHTIKTQAATNTDRNPRARIAEFEVYGQFAEENTVSKLVDGKTDTQWSANCNGTEHYAIVDLGKDTKIGYYEVYHAGNADQNTVAFELQYKDGENWVTADSVSGNTENVTKKTLAEAKTAQYWRLLITDPGTADDTARINELVLMKEEPEPEMEAELSNPVNIYEKLDILNAEIQTQQTLAETETEMKTWLSADKNIMVTELASKAAEGAEPAKMRVMTYTPVASDKPITVAHDAASVTVTRCTANTGKNAADGHVSQIAISTKIIGADAVATSVKESLGQGYLDFTLAAGEKIYIVTAIGGGGRTYKNDGKTFWDDTVVAPAEEAKTLLSSIADEADVIDLNTERQEWWKNFWLASYVKMDTSNDERLKAIEKYYYAAQYYMGSTSKPGEVAPGLFGVWHTTDSPSWDSDYHMNYNFVSTYYGTYSSNRPELGLNGVQALLDYMPNAEGRAANVSELLKVEPTYFIQSLIDAGAIDAENGIEDALLFPVGIGPWGMTCDGKYWGQYLLSAFNSCLITWYYDYTMDREFLENGAYDFLKKAVALYEAVMVKEESEENEDGYEYAIYASQREGSVDKGTWSKNSAAELFSLKNTLSHLIEYSELLGRDADKRDKWKEIYEHLPAQPTMEKDGKTVLAMSEKVYRNGDFVDTPWEHGWIAADALYPAQIYTYFSAPEDLEIFRNTFDTWEGYYGGNNCFGRDFTLGVQMRYDVDKVITEFANVINKQMAPNLAINDNTHGVEKIGATETVNSMMLASADGINKVFPNWLADTDAKFVNLRAKGAFTVSAEYDGAAKEVKEGITITSEAGQDMTLVAPWAVGAIVKDSAGNIVSTEKGTVPNWEDEKTITFKTTKGETYTVWKAESPEIVNVTNPADIKVEHGTEISAVGLPKTVKVTLFDGTEADAEVTWNTDAYDSSKAGTYTLVGTLAESDRYVNYDGLTATVNIEVGVLGIVLDQSEVFLPDVQSTVQLTATVEVEEGVDQTVLWTSSDPSVATVDQNGTVTAVSRGEATVTASVGGYSAVCRIAVGIMGDINSDGDLNSADVVLLLQQINEETLDPKIADVNGDGKVSLADALRLMKTISA